MVCSKAFLLHLFSSIFSSSTFPALQKDYILVYAGHAQKVLTCLSPHGNEFVDRIADLREFLFILCHNIVFIHFFIVMQVIGKCL